MENGKLKEPPKEEPKLEADFGQACIFLWTAITEHETKFATMEFINRCLPQLPQKVKNAIQAAIAVQQLQSNYEAAKAGKIAVPTTQEKIILGKK